MIYGAQKLLKKKRDGIYEKSEVDFIFYVSAHLHLVNDHQ